MNTVERPGYTHTAFDKLKAVGRRKGGLRQSVPEFNGCGVYERLRVRDDSWVRELDRRGMRMCCKSSTTCFLQKRRLKVRKFRRALSIATAIEKRN